MLAITNLAAVGIGLGGVLIGIYGAYLLIVWALNDSPPPVVPVHDENSYM